MFGSIWLILMIGGCAIDEIGDYVDARAAAECGRIERCELGRFEADFNSDEDCLDEITEQLDAGVDSLREQDCDYVPDEAGKCVRRIRGMACEEWAEGETGEACDLVWSCL